MAKVGKFILENLTTGMYADSKVIYREYIQNACDQINKAVELGIFASAAEGLVDIFIDEKKRYVSVKDNATGVSVFDFKTKLGDIANSDKDLNEDMGFRGIGRLCGLAYCKTLKFKTSTYGEDIASIMTCDAQQMRKMLSESQKYTLDEIWDKIVSFSTTSDNKDSHYFEVELIDINVENTDLLDSKKIVEYLSFVAPVPYQNLFIHRNSIYDYAKTIGYKIREYAVKVNGKQIFKDYTTRLKELSGTNPKTYDEISRLEFQSFRNKSGKLMAWMWYGLSRFEKQIPSVNSMRGLRLRASNIQVGSDDSLAKLFKENRGNYYFVGEVFAVSEDLIPNSQRDYFNENEARIAFETSLKVYFYDTLHKLYYDANRIKNDFKKQADYVSKVKDFNEKQKNNGFIDEEDKQNRLREIETAKKDAEEARKHLEKTSISSADDNSPFSEVRKRIEEKFDSDSLTKQAQETAPEETGTKKKGQFVADELSKLNKSERKLVSRIFSIITDNLDKECAEKLIAEIRKELK